MKKLNKSLIGILIITVLILGILAPIVKAESSPFQKFTGMYLTTTEVEPNGKVYVNLNMISIDESTEVKVYYMSTDNDRHKASLVGVNTNVGLNTYNPYFVVDGNVTVGATYKIYRIIVSDSEGSQSYWTEEGTTNYTNMFGKNKFTITNPTGEQKVSLNKVALKGGYTTITPDSEKIYLDLDVSGNVSFITAIFEDAFKNKIFTRFEDIYSNPYINFNYPSSTTHVDGLYQLKSVYLFPEGIGQSPVIYTDNAKEGENELNWLVSFSYANNNTTPTPTATPSSADSEDHSGVYLGWVYLDSRTAKANDKVWFNIAHDNKPSKILATFINKEKNETFSVYLRGIGKGTPYFMVPMTAEPGEYELNNLVMEVNGKSYHFKAEEITPDPATNSDIKCPLTITASETEEITTDDNIIYLDNDKIDENIINKIKGLDENVTIVINADNNSFIKKDVFEAIKGKNINLIIEFGGLLEWNFNGLDIKDPKAIDASIQVYYNPAAEFDMINVDGPESDLCVIDFAKNGILPGKCLIRVNIQDDIGERRTEGTSNVYYYDEANEKFDKVAMQITMDDLGYYEFYINHNSKYVITSETIPEEYVSTKTSDLELNSEISSTTSTSNESKKVENTTFLKDNIISIVAIVLCVILLILLLSGKVLGPREKKE